MLSSVRYLLLYRKHNTASHSAIIPTQSSKPTTCRSERDNARKQTELARTSMSSSNYTARCALKTNEEIKICPVHQKYIQPLTKQLSWRDARRKMPLFPVPLYFVHACSVRHVFVDHGALGICKSSVCTQNRGPLCPPHSHFVQFLFVRKRSGRRKPPRGSKRLVASYG